MRPDHLFLSSSGDLHDTRRTGWSARPLREGFARHHREIETGAQLRACLRAGPYAWPGGYACFFIASDGETLSFEAVRENLYQCLWSLRHDVRDGWRIEGMDCLGNVDGPVYCAHTGKEI